MKQPDLFAWQVFDQKVTRLLRDEYRIPRITKECANSFEELAGKLTGVDPRGFLRTIEAYNNAARPDIAFNPNVHDGLCTQGLAIDKTNWAHKLDTPPYDAYGVTGGVTFTFGGLKVSTEAEVLDPSGNGFGGLYYHNYASGTGLVAGVVFGRLAGEGAARAAARNSGH